MSELAEIVKVRLKESRERQGFTQGELADMAGVGRHTVAVLEDVSAVRVSHMESLVKVADALGESLDYLFGREGFKYIEVQETVVQHKFFQEKWNEESA